MNQTSASVDTVSAIAVPAQFDTRTAPPVEQQIPPSWRVSWRPIFLLAALLVLLYHRVAIKLVTDWYQLPHFSHGFLIPFFASYLVWDKRDTLRRTPVEPTWAGVGLVALGLFELMVGVFGADLFFQR